MDYKSIIKSRKLRIKIMQFLSFVPDEFMLKLQYRIKTGRKLNLKNPKRYTEKLQWYKLNYRDPLMAQCADKYEVRKYVEECGLGHILNELFGVYESPEDIDFDMLPNAFVAKDTLGGGGNSVIIVQDKSAVNIDEIKAQMQEWVDEPINKKHPGREWVYDGRKHRIIIERLLVGDEDGDLPDYKFFCFDGKIECLYFMKNYTKHHDEGILGFLSPEFELLGAFRKDFAAMKEQPEKPESYDEMLGIAETLSKGFPHVRVDFYNINGEIIFGEMTFFMASGYMQFEPDEFDYNLGKKFRLINKG